MNKSDLKLVCDPESVNIGICMVPPVQEPPADRKLLEALTLVSVRLGSFKFPNPMSKQ